MTTSVTIKRTVGNGTVLVEEVTLTKGGPTTKRSHVLDKSDMEVTVALHNGTMLHISEQQPQAVAAAIKAVA